MYEGKESYIFISYSHQDSAQFFEIKKLLEKNNIRFWYDDGLHSGDDWNMVIAQHLKNAALCLLLLSPISAQSTYVKNEINFANNHRIPIFTLRLEMFELPLDVEMMIGRHHMVEMSGGYQNNLLKAFPAEIYCHKNQDKRAEKHPFYVKDREILRCPGTILYKGYHGMLGYNIAIEVDEIRSSDKTAVMEKLRILSKLSCTAVPKIYDAKIFDNCVVTYQEYNGEQTLYNYMGRKCPSEEQIKWWMKDIIDTMDYLFLHNLGVRDIVRSILILNEKKVGLFRLQNLHYGIFRLNTVNKDKCFKDGMQEIATLLYLMATGEYPTLPIGMVTKSKLDKRFQQQINLIIQKCNGMKGNPIYTTFSEIRRDLFSDRISMQDLYFLRKKENEYNEFLKENNTEILQFTRKDNIDSVKIRLMNCSSKKLLTFTRNAIIIGRNENCDLILNNPMLSRYHTRLSREGRDYIVTDMNSINGTYIKTNGRIQKLSPNEKRKIKEGDFIIVGKVTLQLLSSHEG